jgi:hypothetical protein
MRKEKSFFCNEEKSFLIEKFSELWMTDDISMKEIIKHFPCTLLLRVF